MNDEVRPRAPSGNDMIVGQNAAARDGVRRAVVFGNGLQMAEVRLPHQSIIPTGGGYFFVPSLRAADCHRPTVSRRHRQGDSGEARGCTEARGATKDEC
jgi:hypothetical protein